MSTHPVVQRGYDAENKFNGMPGYAHDHSTGGKIDGHYFKDQKSADAYQKAYPEIVLANTDETGDLGRFAYSRHHKQEAAQLKAAELPTKGAKRSAKLTESGISTDKLLGYIDKGSDAREHRKLPLKKVDNRYDGVSKASKILDKRFKGLPESKNDIDSLVGRLFEKYVDNSN